MDYVPHLHQSTNQEDHKPNFHTEPHSQPRLHHTPNFHHRIQESLPMDNKIIDTAPPNGRVTRAHLAYDQFDANQQRSGQSHFMSPSSCQSSPGSSPAPVSAAAEYLRYQEINRGTPRKRVYQDWNQVAVFNTPGEAEEGIKNYENCRWKVGNKFTSREGFKVYWSCREGASCPVQIHLLYHSQLPRVVLFRNQPPHHHAEKVKTRGLLPEVECLIRELFDNGVNKPRRIQFILQKKGMEEVPQTKLSNFLVKLRREASLQGNPVNVKRELSSYYDDINEDDEGDGFYSHDEKSNSALSPSAMCPSVILSTPSEHNGSQGNRGQDIGNSAYSHHSNNPTGQGSNASGPSGVAFGDQYGSTVGRYAHAPYQQGLSDNYVPHNRQGSSIYSGRLSGSIGAVAVKDEDADQSEVVTCSSSRRRSLYCRDETTEDGENLQGDEKNIKDHVLNYMRRSYSNRDMLHIREELRMLKRENKYTALNRLLAFTAGFLQDTFLEERELDSQEGGAGGLERNG